MGERIGTSRHLRRATIKLSNTIRFGFRVASLLLGCMMVVSSFVEVIFIHTGYLRRGSCVIPSLYLGEDVTQRALCCALLFAYS